MPDGRGRIGELNVDCDDPVGIAIREPADERAEQLPFAAGLAWADDFAVNNPVGNGPIHPARVRQVLVLNPAAAPGRFECAQLTLAHRIDERLV